jgi:hypothetical protein
MTSGGCSTGVAELTFSEDRNVRSNPPARGWDIDVTASVPDEVLFFNGASTTITDSLRASSTRIEQDAVG